MKIEDVKIGQRVYTLYKQELIAGFIISKREYISYHQLDYLGRYPVDYDGEVIIYVKALGYPEITRNTRDIYKTKDELLNHLKESIF